MKNITRTITSYKHIFVKMNDDMNISDMKEVICAEKMGSRTSAAYMESNGMEGYVMAKVTTVEETYTMPLETFIANATLVEKEDN